jgi:protein-disulfide isomerase
MKQRVRSTLITMGVTLLLAHCAPSTELSLQPSREVESPIKQTEQTIAVTAQEIYHSSDDPVLGNPSGKITVVEFFDYNCSYCKRNSVEVAKLIDSDKDVRVVIKEFPILGRGSVFAAKAALASGKQGKYREFHTALNNIRGVKNESSVLRAAQQTGLDINKLKTDMESQAVAETIRRNYSIAESLSINGTPTFVLDDAIEPNFASFNALSRHVERIRQNGGCKVC